MSHLKEPVVITFLAVNLSNGAYELVFSAPYRFKFNENFYGSYGWIPPANYPALDTAYYIHNETTNTAIGRIDIYSSNGAFIFNSTDSLPINIAAGDEISIMAPAYNGIGRFGISLVGER